MSESCSLIPSLLLILCTISTLALDTTLQASYFVMTNENSVSYELDQTRNGIIAFSIEAVDNSFTKYISQYVLIDVPNRDAKTILTDLVSACENYPASPVFKNLQYHVKTDTLAYFCPANNSLLLIDQSNYQVKSTISFGISGTWNAKLSAEGMGITVLLMGDLFTTSPKASMLIKVDLQAKTVTNQILLNQGFATNEAVVGYATGSKGAFIATNKMKGYTVTTTVYSFKTIGTKYQTAKLTSFSAEMEFAQILTKIFCVGNYIAVNNAKDLYFLNQKGTIANQLKAISYKTLHSGGDSFFDTAVTVQADSSDLYVRAATETVYKYTVRADTITSKKLGDFTDMKIAYGNSTSGDMMFGFDVDSANFTIFDVQSMKPIYLVPATFDDYMLTDTTYVVKTNDNYIFDLKSNQIIATPRMPDQVYYTKEQHIISQWDVIPQINYCLLQHIDLVTGKKWTTFNISAEGYNCGNLDKLRFSENGAPEFVGHQSSSDYLIYTETEGFLNFVPGDLQTNRGMNFDLDNLSFYTLNSSDTLNQVNVTFYTFNPQSRKFEYRDSNIIAGATAASYAYINTTQSLIVGNNLLVVVNGVGRNAEKYAFSQDWNSASSFKDLSGTDHVILSKYNIAFFEPGSVPGLFVNGKITDLPGTRKESARAKAAGVNSYWIADRLYSSFRSVRFYKVGGSSKQKISL